METSSFMINCLRICNFVTINICFVLKVLSDLLDFCCQSHDLFHLVSWIFSMHVCIIVCLIAFKPNITKVQRQSGLWTLTFLAGLSI
jgi:hypothetical protein